MRFSTLLILFSCTYNDIQEVGLKKEETFSVWHQEMAMYPGLGFDKDTTVNIVHVFNPSDSVIQDMFVTNMGIDKEYLIDSLLNIERFKKDTVRIFKVDCKPLQLNKNKFTFFLDGGFDGKKTRFYQNDKEINIEIDTSTYLNYARIAKSSIDSLGVSVDNSVPTYSIVNKDYNYLRLFLIADSILQFNYSYYWDEY